MPNSLADEIRACVAALREIEAKANPGPWRDRAFKRVFAASEQNDRDIALIVAARNTLLDQIGVMEALANIFQNQVGVYVSVEAPARAWCKAVREAVGKTGGVR